MACGFAKHWHVVLSLERFHSFNKNVDPVDYGGGDRHATRWHRRLSTADIGCSSLMKIVGSSAMDQRDEHKERENVHTANFPLFWPLLSLLAFGIAIRAAVALHPYSGTLSSNSDAGLNESG